MFQKASVGWALGTVLLVVGCGTKTAFPRAETGRATVADSGHVTLHVKDMAKLLKLGWRQWPNRVEEALSGLPGIAALDVDLESDLFHIIYDPAKVTPDVMLETVREQGLEGEIVPPGT
jgi:copper chaperone CopZ